jgi:hypothetical protein
VTAVQSLETERKEGGELICPQQGFQHLNNHPRKRTKGRTLRNISAEKT